MNFTLTQKLNSVLKFLNSQRLIMIILALIFFSQLSFYWPGPIEKPVLFVSRQIPCCGSVYMKEAKALPGIGNFSKYQLAAPGFLCILQPNGDIDTLVNGANPTVQSLQLIDISSPRISYDARKVVFAGLKNGNYKEGSLSTKNAWRIYVININGSGLRQITFDEIPLDLNQFNPLATAVLTGVDDTHPVWLPDGRICFSSTRFRDIAMYNLTRTTNLYVVDEDGKNLHRITTEKNGADKPEIDPLTGKIVYSRWWRNFYWPYDSMHQQAHPEYQEGWLYKDGMTSDLNSVIEEQMFMFNNNAFALTELNPDGSGLKLFSGHYREISSNSVYGGSFDADGNFIGNWFPIEHQTESSGFGGIRKYFRGSGRRPVSLAGTTAYGNLDYYIKDPPSYGIFNGYYAAEPSVGLDGRILYSQSKDPGQDYGIYWMNSDGTAKTLIYDHLGTTELHAQLIEARPLPPIISDQIKDQASLLPPKDINDLRKDGSFEFDCRNIFYNSRVDDGIIAAPAIGGLSSVRFFASPLTKEQFGSLEMLNFPMLYNEIAVDDFGRVLEVGAPANVALFEQGRTSQSLGYKISRTGGGIMDGAAHVTGFNFGKPGQKVSCVGCHAGHSLIPVPEDPEDLFFHNIAPGAIINTSSSMNAPGYLIDKKNKHATHHWFTPESVSPQGQWINLKWLAPVYTKSVVLHNIPDTNRAQVKSCTIELYEDSSLSKLIKSIQSPNPLSASGTEFKLEKVLKIQSMRIVFNDVKGGIYHWNAATLGEIEVIGSIVHPNRFIEVLDCKGKAYGSHRTDSCGQCLLPEDPKFNDCLTSEVDINQNNHLDDLTIVPNPSNQKISILYNKELTATFTFIINISSGKKNLVFPDCHLGICSIGLQDFPPGVYMIEMNFGGQCKRSKFIKI
ncbi:MAG: hypothetical protein IPO62_00405 [Saprospiraceae bacterium]|nr:hypothetical protein [Saprospiraceae bacterium]